MSRKATDTSSLSRLFHLNSQPFIDERPGQAPPLLQKSKVYQDATRVELPVTKKGTVERLSSGRRSVREFRDAPLPLEKLAAVLRSGYGPVGPDRLTSGQEILRRPVPSAGGLYPLEAYLLVRNVSTLSPGIYHYDSVGDDLAVLALVQWENDAARSFISWKHIQTAPVVICLSAVFDRTQSKYGPRGYRYILLEAGHVTQNICLSATEYGLGSLCLGGFHDGVLNRLLGLDGEQEAVVYTIAVGADS